jgi:hypothetical protein
LAVLLIGSCFKMQKQGRMHSRHTGPLCFDEAKNNTSAGAVTRAASAVLMEKAMREVKPGANIVIRMPQGRGSCALAKAASKVHELGDSEIDTQAGGTHNWNRGTAVTQVEQHEAEGPVGEGGEGASTDPPTAH